MKNKKELLNDFKKDLHSKLVFCEFFGNDEFIEMIQNWLPSYSKKVEHSLVYHIISNQANCFVQNYHGANIIVWDESFWDLYDKFLSIFFMYPQSKNEHKKNGFEQTIVECVYGFYSYLYGFLAYKFNSTPWLMKRLLCYQEIFSDTFNNVIEYAEKPNEKISSFKFLSRLFALYHEIGHIVFESDTEHYNKLLKMVERWFVTKSDWYYTALADDYSKRNNLSANQKEEYINIFKQYEMCISNPTVKSDFNLRDEIIADLFAAQEISAFLIKEYKNIDSVVIMSCQIISLLHDFYSFFAIIKSTWNSFLPLIRCPHIKKVDIDYTTENMVVNIRNLLASLCIQNLLMLHFKYDYSKMDTISKKYLDSISYIQDKNIIDLFINPLHIAKIIDKTDDGFHIFI